MADEHKFGVELVTPEAGLFGGAASAVILRTSGGDLTILDGHTDLVGDVAPTVVRVETAEGVQRYCVHGGFVQVRTASGAAAGLLGDADASARSTRVTILAGIAENVDEIDVARAQAAREAASAELAGLSAEDQDEEASSHRHQLVAALARAELRLESAGVAVA